MSTKAYGIGKRALITFLTFLAVSSLSAGCKGREEKIASEVSREETSQKEAGKEMPPATKNEPQAAKEEREPEAIEITARGAIVGEVKFVGESPAKEKLEVNKDTEVCAETDMFSEALIVGEDGGIQNAVVFLTHVRNGNKLEIPTQNPVLDQKGCRYVPHMLLVPMGATLDILNSDGVLHNVHTSSVKNPEINRAQPMFKKVIQEKFDQPEIIKVTCDVHNWMNAWVVVQGHPYYVVTDTNGLFRITDVPPGDYELKVWHETLGEKIQQVMVRPGEETRVLIVRSLSSAEEKRASGEQDVVQ